MGLTNKLIALPRHLFAITKNSKTLANGAKNSNMLFHGHFVFFNGDRFEVINTTLVLCIPVILSMDMFLDVFDLVLLNILPNIEQIFQGKCKWC